MKIRKNFLSILLVAAMVISLMPLLTLPVLAATSYDLNVGPVNIVEAGDYIITGNGNSSCNGIKVNPNISGTINITLINVNDEAGISIGEYSSVNLTINGTNTLRNGSSAGITVVKNASLTITAESTGSLTAYGGDYAAGIGGGKASVNGKVSIYGGTVNAYGTQAGAGIGSGGTDHFNKFLGIGDSVSIYGGTVNAYGGQNAAGIGGGFNFYGGTVNISGSAEVTAVSYKGGVNSYHGGAGIGSGVIDMFDPANCMGGPVNISGSAKVTALGGYNGAGIGGSNCGGGSPVNISDSAEVTAVGGVQAPGIGGGYGSGDANTVNISGNAKVTATGNGTASGIGTDGGYDGFVNISGGTVKANGLDGEVTISGGTVSAGGIRGDLFISGGSVVTDFSGAVYQTSSLSTQVYKTTVSGLPADTDVSCAINSGDKFACATDAGGYLYLWLPSSSLSDLLMDAGNSYYKASGIISASTGNPLSAVKYNMIAVDSLPFCILGEGYSQTLTDAGDNTSYTWEITNGLLPDGLILSGGVISGTPTKEGSFTFTVKVKNAIGTTKTKTLSITVYRSVDLKALSVTGSGGDTCTLTPAFDWNITTYNVQTVSAPVTSISITAITADANATLAVNGTAAASGVASTVNLTIGENRIPVTVTSADKLSQKSYMLTVILAVISTSDGGTQSKDEQKTIVSTDGKSTSISGKTDDTGKKSEATLSGADVGNLLKKASEASGGLSGLKAIKFDVKSTGSVTQVELNVPAASFKEIADKTNAGITVSTSAGTVTFNAKAVDSIAKAGTKGDVSISITKLDSTSLPSGVKNVVGKRPVYDFTVTSGGKTVSSFDGGTATVSIPYKLLAGENPHKIVIYYISDSGALVKVKNCKYDPATGMVTFATAHFSKYAVGYSDVSFSDVSGWYADDAYYLEARGVMNGQGGGQFSPDANITRAEFVTILARMSGDDLSGYTSSAFTDVAASDWYFAAAEWAYKNGIAVGSEGKFNPNANIARQDIAVMLARYADKVAGYILPKTSSAIAFNDSAKISSYASDAVTAMQQAGIISGNVDDSFAPTANATRAQAAKMIAVLLQSMA